MRHPVVEIGDDGLHLLVVDAAQDHRLEPIICEERPLPIGAAIKRSGSLDDGTADLVVETARRLARRAHDVAVAPLHTFLTGEVATTAGDALLDRITTATGVAPRRLHPEEDTRLAFLAAMVGASDPHTPVVVLRLGWRHVQLALGRDGQVLWTTEAELGIDDLIRSLEIEDGLTEPRVQALSQVIRQRLRAVAAPLHHRSAGWQMVAIGTAVRHLAAAFATARQRDIPPRIHGTSMTFREVLDARTRFDADGSLSGTLAPTLPMCRGDEPPLGAKLAVAAAIIAEVADALWVDRITVSGWETREAVVLETLTGAGREPCPAARHRSVVHLARTLAHDPPHAEHVARIATSVFDCTARLHGLAVHDRELLEHAARLHDVGASISPAARHRLGGAFLEKATLPGFSTDDLMVLACLVRFHKGAGINGGFRPYEQLSGERRRAVAKLAALLRVADGLDRGHDGAVTNIDSKIHGRIVRLTIEGEANLEIARWGASAAAPFFERTFDHELQVTERSAYPITDEPLVVREALAGR